ncbi:hypothetical protein WJX74_009695 [Apatococcus lobatus]|uniref:Uncharacterized protein n=1 Tax=Apatococcus lobatus TaxID=904363 RepID=A0AAW1QTM4_9CHLO
MQTTQEWLSRVCAALTSSQPEWGPETSTSSGILQSPPLDLEWALPRSASMPEPVSRARQQLVQQIMAEQQARMEQPPVLPPRDMRLERFLVRLKEYQESVRQAIKDGPLSHRSGKQASDEELENSGGPIDVLDVLDHIMAAQEALAMSQLARSKNKQKGTRGSMLLQKANRVLSMLQTNRASMSSRGDSLAPSLQHDMSRKASMGFLPPNLDGSALRQWLATGGEEHAYGEDAPAETSRSELDQRDDEAMLQKVASQMRTRGVEESPPVTTRDEFEGDGIIAQRQASADLATVQQRSVNQGPVTADSEGSTADGRPILSGAPDFVELAFIPMPVLAKLPEPSSNIGGRTALMQARLQRIWNILEMPPKAQLHMAKKWSSGGQPVRFADAIHGWEMAVAGLLERERALGRLLRARQAMNRAGLLQLAAHANALEEAALEFATAAAQQELSAQLLQEDFGDDLSYRGSSYPGPDAVSPDQLDMLVKAASDRAKAQGSTALIAQASKGSSGATSSTVSAESTARSSSHR